MNFQWISDFIRNWVLPYGPWVKALFFLLAFVLPFALDFTKRVKYWVWVVILLFFSGTLFSYPVAAEVCGVENYNLHYWTEMEILHFHSNRWVYPLLRAKGLCPSILNKWSFNFFYSIVLLVPIFAILYGLYLGKTELRKERT